MTTTTSASANRFRFRAWDKSNLEMFEVRELKFHSSVSNPYTVFGIYGDGSDAEDVILMQSTGLKAKDGRDIFESDIVAFNSISMLDDGPLLPRRAIVRWNEEMLCWEFVSTDGQKIPNLSKEMDDGQFEVIGDIYSNPDLLPSA